MNLPGFTGESSIYPQTRHYQSSWKSPGSVRNILIAQIVTDRASSTAREVGIGRGLGFSCGGLGCACNGDSDCNDMFSANVCGPNAVCFETGGSVVCVCLR
jgi:hypothetical protein